jgi:hypothetical protein
MIFPLDDKLKKYLKGFVFPQVPVEDWIITNKMKLCALLCSKCSNELNPLIPIASKMDRGVVYQPCSCGELPPVTLVSACSRERRQDVEFFQLLSKELR